MRQRHLIIKHCPGHAVIRFKLGEQIEKKQFQEGRHITVQEVAAGSGVNRMTLSKILNQRGYSTGTEIVDKLCRYFGCPVGDLLEYVPDEAESPRAPPPA